MKALAFLALALSAVPVGAASLQQRPYGRLTDGRAVQQFTLRNAVGMTVSFINYGAIITDIRVPGARGQTTNVALGFSSLAEYEARNADYGFGAVIGRYAGRIAGARFPIDGRKVGLKANDGPNVLHGGGNGLDSKLWSVRRIGGASTAVLTYRSPAGEQGFPGTLNIRVTYRLQPDNALRIDYAATTDAPTVLNLTNHSYFNLAGAGSGSALNHRLTIFSNRYAETSVAGIPTGRMLPVAGTPFDFRQGSTIESKINVAHPQMAERRGYNHSWLLGSAGSIRLAARLSDPLSRRAMEVWTDQPALHVYTANWFSGKDKGAQGAVYKPGDGVALETQHFSDAPNQPALPSTLLRPGQTFRSTTIYRFLPIGLR